MGLILKRIVQLLLIIILIISCTSKEKTYYVFIDRDIEEITEKNYYISNVWILISQLHTPLFYLTPEGTKSEIFKSWDIKDDFKKFNLCLKDNLKFSDQTKVSIKDIHQNFLTFNRRKEFPVNIKKTTFGKGCIEIEFVKSFKNFTSIFSSFDYLILNLKGRKNKILPGISDYAVKVHNKKEIILGYVGSKKSSPYFTKIHYININTNSKMAKKIVPHEVNYMRLTSINKYRPKNYNGFEKFSLNILFVINNFDDTCLRKKFASYMYENKDKYIDVYQHLIPSDKIIKSNSFIPYGMPGHVDVKLKSLKNIFCKIKDNKSLSFYNFYKKVENNLQQFAKGLKKSTNIRIKIKNVDPKDFEKIVKRKRKKYDLIFFGITRGDPLLFLESLLTQSYIKRHLKNAPIDLQKKYRYLTQNDVNHQELVKSIKYLNVQLIKRGYIIPIGQTKKIFYYPKNLKGIKNYLIGLKGYYQVKDVYIE